MLELIISDNEDTENELLIDGVSITRVLGGCITTPWQRKSLGLAFIITIFQKK